MSLKEFGSEIFSTSVFRLRQMPVIEVFGEIDINTVSRLRAAFEEAAGQTESWPAAVVVDLSGIRFMDCRGLRLLIEQKKRIEEHGSELRLIPGEGGADLVLRLAELEGEFTIYGDPWSAVGDPESAT